MQKGGSSRFHAGNADIEFLDPPPSNSWTILSIISVVEVAVMQLAHFLPFFEVTGDGDRSVTRSRSANFGLLSSRRKIIYSAQDTYANVRDQSAVQLEVAMRSLWDRFFDLFVTGDPSNAGEFAGLEQIVRGAAFEEQILDARGDVLTAGMIDHAQQLVGQGGAFKGVIYTSPRGLAEICWAIRAAGSLPQELPVELPGGDGSPKCVLMTHVNGWLVVPSESVPAEVFKGKTVTTIWFLKIGPGHLHGIVPASTGRNIMIRVRSTNLIEKSAIRYDLTFPAGIAVTEVNDIAVIRNVLVR